MAQEFFLVHAQVSGAGGKGFFIWDKERFVGALEAEKLADNVVSAQVIGASEIVDSGREGECGFQMAYHFPHVGNAAIVVDGVGDAAFSLTACLTLVIRVSCSRGLSFLLSNIQLMRSATVSGWAVRHLCSASCFCLP